MKSPSLALILSLLIPGVGQMYNGEVGKGFFLLLIYLFSYVCIAIGIGVVMVPAVWIWGMIDAYKVAQQINAHQYKS